MEEGGSEGYGVCTCACCLLSQRESNAPSHPARRLGWGEVWLLLLCSSSLRGSTCHVCFPLPMVLRLV